MTRFVLTPHQFVRWFAVERAARTEFRSGIRAQLREALAADADRGDGRPEYAEISHGGVTVERIYHDGRIEPEPRGG